ncbi:MAG: hypothetical protein COT00_03920 [Candidatus Omnitrophica bacterium CG07_land_8_20_14_0_80_50_8]|nr:MAG: hypothetical protein COT00_03920 [Candidatus Omnitrophica bacterium CG07_land_8_20_14_0_80_50_8]
MSQKKTVFIIDDEPNYREMLGTFLMSSGYRVMTACDGEEALALLKQTQPDLIILDMQMPKMGGVAFYNRILTPAGKSKYPVIVLTARTNLEELFADLPVDAFIAKPFKMEELLAQVRQALRSKQVFAGIPKTIKKTKKVLLVEDDKEKFDHIVGELAACGFFVNGVRSGAEAIARAPAESPDIVLAKLALPDIYGDFLAMELRQVLREDAKVVLYAKSRPMNDSALAKKIYDRISAFKLIESDDPRELAVEMVKLFE